MTGTTRRTLVVAAAQLGPIPRAQPRREVVARLVDLLRRAHRDGAELVVFPEAALTPFFPHWWIEDEDELDSYFERDMPNATVQPLFDAARELKVGFCLGYAELDLTTYPRSSTIAAATADIVSGATYRRACPDTRRSMLVTPTKRTASDGTSESIWTVTYGDTRVGGTFDVLVQLDAQTGIVITNEVRDRPC